VAWAWHQEAAAELRASLLTAAQLLSEAESRQSDPAPEPVLPQAPQALDQTSAGMQEEVGLAPEEVVSSWLLCDLCLEMLRQQVREETVAGPRAGLCAPVLATWDIRSQNR
jgi:hypothetical protein